MRPVDVALEVAQGADLAQVLHPLLVITAKSERSMKLLAIVTKKKFRFSGLLALMLFYKLTHQVGDEILSIFSLLEFPLPT